VNLWFRLVFFFLAVRFRKPVGVMEACVTPFRCWPLDLDTLLHMNNSRYLAVMDLARVDLIVRCGMWKTLKTRGHYPIVEAQTIRYRKSIQFLERFNIVTQIVGWDEKSFFLTQMFMRGSDVVAEAVVKGRFLKRSRGTVPSAEIMALAGGPEVSPPLSGFIAAWNKGLLASR
jgi:acyl-CoA thioesterase FadM